MIVHQRSRRVMELGMRAACTFPYSGHGPDDEIEYKTPRVIGVVPTMTRSRIPC